MSTPIAYRVAILLAALTFAVELVGHLYTGSVGLLSDALHLCADAVPLMLGLWAVWAREEGREVTLLERNVTISNIIALCVVGFLIACETISRYWYPEPVAASLLWFALVGFIGQGGQYWCTRNLSHAHAHTAAGQRLHFVLDWGATGAVLLGGVVISFGGSGLWDTAASGAIALFSFTGAYTLWRELRRPHLH